MIIILIIFAIGSLITAIGYGITSNWLWILTLPITMGVVIVWINVCLYAWNKNLQEEFK